VVYNYVWKRHANFVCAVYAKQAADCALYRDCGVPVYETLGVERYVFGGVAGLVNQLLVEM